jgi:hypothetical protein
VGLGRDGNVSLSNAIAATLFGRAVRLSLYHEDNVSSMSFMPVPRDWYYGGVGGSISEGDSLPLIWFVDSLIIINST